MPAIAAVLLVLAALVIGQWPLLRDIHGMWMDKYGAYSHGYLVLAIAIVLAVRHWRRPPPLAPARPVWAALPVLAMLLAASVALDRLFVGGIRSLLLPPLVLGAVAVGAGLPAARRLLAPIAFLYLALPVWGPINGILQSLTTRVAGASLKLMGVPVYLEGNFVYLPEGTFEIAAGCSGLNFFLTALTMGAFACAFLVQGRKQRLTIVAVAVGLGMVANWIRVVSLVAVGHWSGMQHYLIRVDHLMFGWAIFMVAMLPVFLLARRASAGPAPEREAPPMLSPPVPFVAGAAATVLACLLLLVPLVVPGGSVAGQGTEAPFEEVVFPSGWSPGFVGASIHRDLVRAGDEGVQVEIVRARYERQRQEARVSQYGNSTTGSGWTAIRSVRVDLPAASPVVTEHEGAVNGRTGLVWDWYVVAGKAVSSSKLDYRLQELLTLLSSRRDAEIIALHSNCEGSCDAARVALTEVGLRLLKADDPPIASQFARP